MSRIRDEVSGRARSVSTGSGVHFRRQGNAYSCLGSTQVSIFGSRGAQYLTFDPSTLGESPPPMPRACFGRDDLIEEIATLAESLTPIALIGAGGIGKTSIGLAVLHHSRTKERFGNNRRFIRCDQFPASRANFLIRLSETIGAGIGTPKDLIPLHPFLFSKEMIIVLDNAESILDPQGLNGQEIYDVVEELSQFSNICLCITSRITTVPPDCKRLDVPTLSLDAARRTFHRIYDNDKQPDLINNILEQLDFHPLSVTLLATVAHQNKWNNHRLAREWEQRQTGVLQTGHNKSLAGTIELSLASPMFKELGPDARELLGVIAFFPQGIDENNLDWLFPTTPNRAATFDTFCVLSLTYQNDGFITMLAPLRNYLCPKDPLSSPLFCTTREHYFVRMSKPTFGKARWIASEDVNVERLLDISTSIDANSDDAWDTCANFLKHLHWHKPRYTVLTPKIKGLSDDHPSKSRCLFALAQLAELTGNIVERKELLIHALKLERGQGDDYRVARTLRELSDANRMLELYEEGIQQAKEALEIPERLGDLEGQANCLSDFAWVLYEGGQLDAAEEAATRANGLLPVEHQESLVRCQSYRTLGCVFHSKGEKEKAIHHFKVALGIASPFEWHDELFWANYALALVFLSGDELDVVHTHIEQAKLHAVNNTYNLGRAMELQARAWYQWGRLEEATSEASRALEIFEKLGAAEAQELCRDLLQDIERVMKPGEKPACL